MLGQGSKEVPAVTGTEAPVGTMKMKGPVTSTSSEQVAVEKSPSNGAAGNTHLCVVCFVALVCHNCHCICMRTVP